MGKRTSINDDKFWTLLDHKADPVAQLKAWGAVEVFEGKNEIGSSDRFFMARAAEDGRWYNASLHDARSLNWWTNEESIGAADGAEALIAWHLRSSERSVEYKRAELEKAEGKLAMYRERLRAHVSARG